MSGKKFIFNCKFLVSTTWQRVFWGECDNGTTSRENREMEKQIDPAGLGDLEVISNFQIWNLRLKDVQLLA